MQEKWSPIKIFKGKCKKICINNTLKKINNNNSEPESLHESFAKRLGIDFYKDGNLNGNFTS